MDEIGVSAKQHIDFTWTRHGIADCGCAKPNGLDLSAEEHADLDDRRRSEQQLAGAIMAIPQREDPARDVEPSGKRRRAETTGIRAREHPYPHQSVDEFALVNAHGVHPQRVRSAAVAIDIRVHIDTRKAFSTNVFNHDDAAIRCNLGLA